MGKRRSLCQLLEGREEIKKAEKFCFGLENLKQNEVTTGWAQEFRDAAPKARTPENRDLG